MVLNNKILKKILFAVLAVGLFGISCGRHEESNSSTETPTVAVKIATASLQDLPSSTQFSGTVASLNKINISTKVMGEILSLPNDIGDFVSKGTVLVQIKDADLKAQKNQVEASLAEAEASLKNAETNYGRIKALYSEKSATQKELDDITTNYNISKARTEALKSKLNEINDVLTYTRIIAPFDGFVTGKFASRGDLASPGMPILAFEKSGAMKMVVNIPETNISVFTIGDTLNASIPAASYYTDKAVVQNINTSGNPGSRQFTVEISLPEDISKSGVKNGMFGRVMLKGNSGDRTILIPKTVLIERGQLTGIYTVNDASELILRWVRTGREFDEQVEILSGLSVGETFVAVLQNNLRDGLKVQFN